MTSTRRTPSTPVRLQVYGVVRSDRPDPDGLTGAGEPGGPVRLVRSGPLAAAVSEVGDYWQPVDGDAATYLDVLIRLLDDGPVLPVTFGTVAPDDDAVRHEVLDPAAPVLIRRLDELDGLVEVRLEIARNEEDELRELMAHVPQIRDLVRRARVTGGEMSAQIEVGEEISIGLQQRRDELDAQVAEKLRDLAVADRATPGEDPTVIVHAFLVRRKALRRFDQAVHRVVGELGDNCTVRYVGPLPAFDFLEEPEPVGGAPLNAPDTPSGRWGW